MSDGSWCPECGPDVAVDEDGTCAACGATSLGAGADTARVLNEEIDRLIHAGLEMERAKDGQISTLREALRRLVFSREIAAQSHETAMDNYNAARVLIGEYPLDRKSAGRGMASIENAVGVEDVEPIVAELDAARAAVGEAWFAGGATLAEAIERKCRMLEVDAAKAAEEAKQEREVACENTPWPWCECPGCETARARAGEDGGDHLRAEAHDCDDEDCQLCHHLGGLRASCSCCRKCGATVPCESAIAGEGCDGRCFCGLDDEEGSDG